MPSYGTRYSNKPGNKLSAMDRETQERATEHRNLKRQKDRDPGVVKVKKPTAKGQMGRNAKRKG